MTTARRQLSRTTEHFVLPGPGKKVRGNGVGSLVAGVFMSCVLVMFSLSTVKAIPENLNGSIQLTGVSSSAENADVQSLDQRYTLNWQRQLTPYVTLRGLLTYNRFGTDLSEGGNVWQRQVQPLGELQWSHPYFTFMTSLGHRTTTSNDHTTDLVQNSYLANLSTRSEKIATALLSYSLTHTYNNFDRSQRDSRDHVLRATVSRSFGSGSLNYSFTREKNNVASSFLEQTSTVQQLRWTQMNKLLANRLRLTADYTFDNRRQTDKLIGADTTVRPIDVLTALYGRDASPELGSLNEVAGLTDGEVDRPTDPVIEIGRGVGDQNIGVDFGFPRMVRGFYIYTDVPSGSSLRWDVYTSPDNVTWSRIPAAIQVAYNTAFQRYEVLFANIESRYVKVVNVGLNDVIDVKVTELQALEEFTRDQKSSRSQTVHRLTTGLSYRLTSTLQSKADFYYRYEPGDGFSNSRDEVVYALGVTHTPSDRFTQSLTWQTSWEDFPETAGKDKDITASYSLKVTPGDFISASFTAYTRNNTLARVRFQEANSVSLQLNSLVLPGLELRAEGNYNRNNQFVAGQKFDTWTWRSGVATELTSALKANASVLYQTTMELGPDIRQIRRVYSGDVAYQLTSAIFVRGTITAGIDESRSYVSQDYLGSWRLSSTLSWSTVVTIISSESASRLEKEVYRLNYQITPRTLVYGSFSNTEAGTASGVQSFQVGIRTGF